MWRLQLINEVLTSREATTYMYLLGIILESAKPCYSRCVALALRVGAGQISHNGQYELEGSASS